MLRRTALVLIVLAGLLGAAVGSAFGTAGSGFSAETAFGPLVDRELDADMKFPNGSKVKLDTKGPIEVAAQRIVIAPGGTLGWHSHPGPTIVTVKSGTLSFYHAEDCTHRINYTQNQSFSNLPSEIHLARNESTTTEVVLFASYFVPVGTTAAGGLRINQDSPGAECPL